MQLADGVTGLAHDNAQRPEADMHELGALIDAAPTRPPTPQALESRLLETVPVAVSPLLANSLPLAHQPTDPLLPSAPPYRKSKVVLLRGVMNQGQRSSGASPVAPSPISIPPPLLGLCRPFHQLQYQVVLEADWRPSQFHGFHSAVSWLDPHFSLGC